MGAGKFIKPIIAALLAAAPAAGFAQYYSWGVNPASVRWNKLETTDVKLIYAAEFEENARRTMWYFDTVRPYIGYGYRHGTMPTPVVLHSRNMMGNGMVMWAPKRIELLAAPGTSYSEPWLKQLAIHEYRHNIQYNNLNRGTQRVLTWFLGQQIAFLGVVQFSLFLVEGDATMAETEISAFGRGLQPTFNMHYRAVGDVGSRRYASDLWFCGSYKRFVPDHYRLGYQMVRWANDRLGEDFVDNMARYVSRNPQFIAPLRFGLQKHYGMTLHGVFERTFSDLNAYWDSLPATEDTAVRISAPVGSYTVYSWPLWTDEGDLIAFRSDFDRPSRIVRVDPATGSETTVAYTGAVSSRPVLCGGRLWWTEYRSSVLWDQKVSSRLCFLDLATGRRGERRSGEQIFHPVALPGEGLCYVSYDLTGRFSIVRGVGGREAVLGFPLGTEVCGLAWDDLTGKLYFTGLDDRGMWLGETGVADGTYREITPARHITLSDLRAADGKLYYGSIASGRDEAHCFDPAAGIEYRLTGSAYGSFQPSPAAGGGRVAVTTYDENGYHLAVQATDEAAVQEQRQLPSGVANPDWARWKVPKMDGLVFDAVRDSASRAEIAPRRYKKALNLFNIHSWVPLGVYPPEVMEEMVFTPNLGATAMSQSLLSDAVSWLSYGWNRRGGSSLRGGMTYYGLGPVIDVGFNLGGGTQILYTRVPSDIRLRSFYSFNARVSLPMTLSSGNWHRWLTPAIEYYYTNGLIFRQLSPTQGKLTRGVERLSASLMYASQTRMAYRDILPRWGFAARASWVVNPTNREFNSLASAFVRGYLPGILPHHSLTLRAAAQQTLGAGRYMFSMKEVFPRAALYNFQTRRWLSGSADYQFPVWCPDRGIPGLIFFKRVRINVFGDYARWQGADGEKWSPLYSYGGDVTLDVNLFRMPAAADFALRFTFAKPSDSRGVTFMFGIETPL